MKKVIPWILFCALLGMSRLGVAQSTNSGDIRGIVTDPSGAAVPGVTVTVLNTQTGVSKDFATNQQGLYDTSSVVAGSYRITFEKQGFEQLVRGPVTVDVGQTTVDGQLVVGASTTTVTVSTDVPLLNTETGSQTQTLESKTMDQLPNIGAGNGPDWQNFVVLLPGVTGTAMGAQGSANPGQESSANGNLPYTNVLEDGATSTLPASANANPAPFDDVDEVQVNLSSFSAQYGIGGVIINQVTKGGGNRFHGSAYENFQNDALNAPQFGFGSKSTVPYLRYDDFGGTVGGPIAIRSIRNKAFFFFGYDQIINNAVTLNHFTVPDAATLAGNFTGQAELFDPTTQTIALDPMGNPYPVRQSFASENGGNNSLPQSVIDTVAANYAKFFPTTQTHPSYAEFEPGTIVNGIPTANFTTQPPTPRPWKRYFGRLDYDITPNHRLTLTDNQGDQGNNGDGNGVTICPIACQVGDVDNNNAQITEVWNISPTTINEARMGFTDQLNFFSDAGTGKGYPQQLGWQFAHGDVIPQVDFDRGPYQNVVPGTNAVYKEFAYDPSDVVTMIRGKHILHFGGEFAFYRDNATPWANINAGQFHFSGVYTEQWTTAACGPTPKYEGQVCPDPATGDEFADFLLGLTNNWSAGVTPEYGARLKKPQMFVQDDIKVYRNLTVNAGLRYEINHGFNEVKGNEAVFDPTIQNPATKTPGAYWFGSTHTNGRNALQDTVFSTFLPRIGASWLVRPNTTIRGGFGLYAYNYSLDQYGRGMGGVVESAGSDSDQTNGITPVTQLGGSGTIYGTATPLPYTSGSTSPTRFNGQTATWTPNHTPIPKIWQWNFGVERELATNTVATLTYVGSHGNNLPFATDLNGVPENELSANDQQFRPYQQYQSIQGYALEGVSNYNSLQATINRRFSNGISFSFNYVWSHFLDDQDSSGWGSHSGPEYVQHVSSLKLNQAALNYGPSNFDERHAFKGYVVYELPFGLGKTFLNRNRIVDAAVGGWQVSGTVVEASGNPFQPYINSGNLYTLASLNVNGTGAVVQYPNRVHGVSLKPSGSNYQTFYNPGAFAAPGNGVFGTLGRNPIVGPGLNYFNLSAGKTFSIDEKVKFQIRADAANAFNHPNFTTPNNQLLCPSSGPCTATESGTQITGVTAGPRTMQLTGRFSF
jgi:Carboxypeptidase regulatory-like domain